jgi:hypothetical protein
MLLPADRDFAAVGLLGRLSADGAQLLVPAKSGRNLPAIGRLGDSTFLARLGALTVRVIDAGRKPSRHPGRAAPSRSRSVSSAASRS